MHNITIVFLLILVLILTAGQPVKPSVVIEDALPLSEE
jgi:hypothetical protein